MNTTTPAAADVSEQSARRAQRRQNLVEQMRQHVLQSIQAGHDDTMPGFAGKPGMAISAWLAACDGQQEHLLFNLVHLALNKATLEHIHEAGAKLAQHVADDYATMYAGARA
jgi:hypothetical protein